MLEMNGVGGVWRGSDCKANPWEVERGEVREVVWVGVFRGRGAQPFHPKHS